MAKYYLSVSADYNTGEAELTKGTRLELEDLIRHDPLIAADILSDCVYDFSQLYERAKEAMKRERCGITLEQVKAP
jgi:hypothetical protein